ncbi:ubiquinol-cytochrome c reductase iron-sulfur subunit [Gordonia hydrophobica]|uniref:Cytochrome bc1 complex Rieske iron-sulfur subunit n=1 Tax=Gordonia hydrophobica TaxID=40516 RepID=A0ABZ2TYV1_9ACTN|nr:Rieske (2Fe-2S) protein [Gordonia hydrophobica]MBM7367233.1 Rieske Fe-S protein [Gordonia hydrophobica]
MPSTPVTPDSSEPTPATGFSRRTFVAGAGAVAGAAVLGTALSACGGDSSAPESTVSVPSNAPTGTLAETADVPVGSGVITAGVVLTQPTAGTYEAFTAECTHAGCALSEVAGSAIECPCHGSRFHLDGTVAQGPAERSLTKVAIRVDGTNIVRA